MRAGLGLYVDCDVFCLRPIADADYIFGWETGKSINNAVLKMPADCPTLAALLFALVDFPGDWIATFDDDRLYPADTLARLWDAAAGKPATIICNGGRQMVVHDGHFAGYCRWPMTLSPEPTFLVLPLGGFGILYPPGSLNAVVGDRDLIRDLAPLNDDIWFKAMSLTRDVPCHAIGGTHLMPEFKFKGSTTLSQLNQEGSGQDAALGQVFGRFGLTVESIRAKEARLHAGPGSN